MILLLVQYKSILFITVAGAQNRFKGGWQNYKVSTSNNYYSNKRKLNIQIKSTVSVVVITPIQSRSLAMKNADTALTSNLVNYIKKRGLATDPVTHNDCNLFRSSFAVF